MKKIEAVFYDENKLQSALGMLDSFGVDITNVTVSGGGKSLLEQTFSASYGEQFGSATGFAYSSSSFPKNTPSLEAYPMPESLAHVADDLASTTHKNGIVPDDLGSGDAPGEILVLRLKVVPGCIEHAEAILNKNGARRIRIIS